MHTFGTTEPALYLNVHREDRVCRCPCGHHSPPFVHSPTRVLVAPRKPGLDADADRVAAQAKAKASRKGAVSPDSVSDKSVVSVQSETSLASLFAPPAPGAKALPNHAQTLTHKPQPKGKPHQQPKPHQQRKPRTLPQAQAQGQVPPHVRDQLAGDAVAVAAATARSPRAVAFAAARAPARAEQAKPARAAGRAAVPLPVS